MHTPEELVKSMTDDNAEFYALLHECEDIWNGHKDWKQASKLAKIVFQRYCASKMAEQAYKERISL